MMRKSKELVGGVLLFFGMLTSAFADITEVNDAKLEQLIAEGVAVVDVRRVDEWQSTGVIEGAQLLTFFDQQGRYDAQKWLENLDKIAPKGSPVVLICAAGVRSKTIADLLDKRLGYEGVHNHTLGMYDWIRNGKPVVGFSDVVAPPTQDTK